jgi:hypothetical protein
MLKHSTQRIPVHLKDRFSKVESLITAYAESNLDNEYCEYCLYLTAALARKKETPFAKGKEKLWACGVIHAIGMVNFLFDKNTKPFVSASDLYSDFGVSSSSGSARSKLIRDLFDMFPSDPNWTLPSRQYDNPLIWLASVNGHIVDIRQMPLEVQEQAFEQNIIPFIPQ